MQFNCRIYVVLKSYRPSIGIMNTKRRTRPRCTLLYSGITLWQNDLPKRIQQLRETTLGNGQTNDDAAWNGDDGVYVDDVGVADCDACPSLALSDLFVFAGERVL